MSIGLVTEPDQASEAIPSWLESAETWTPGLDPLGMQSITIDRVMPRLVPGILALSRRARYLSFYCFLLDEVFRTYRQASQNDLSRFIRFREYEFALAVQFCPRGCGQRASGAVGGSRTGPDARSDREVFARRESVESYMGGYGLYYRTPMQEFGLVAPRGEVVEKAAGTLPRDVLRSDRAIALAAQFRAAIEQTRYYREFFHSEQEIPRAVLEDLATTSCLCRLDDFPEERRSIHDVILGQPDAAVLTTTAEVAAAADQRRRSFALVLWAIAHSPGTAGGAGDQAVPFRRTVWTAFTDRLGEESPLERTLGQWTALIGKDYAQDALAAIWSDVCRQGFMRQRVDGMLPNELDQFLERDLLASPSVEVASITIAIRANQSTAEFAQDLSEHVRSLALEDIRASASSLRTAAAGLVLLLELRNRLTPALVAHSDWQEIAAQSSNWQPSLGSLMARLEQHLETDPSLGQTLSWLTNRFVIDAHQRIAYSKLPEFTFRFRWEEGRLRFYSSDPRHFEPTDIRLDAISRIAEDLGLLDRTQSLNALTPTGGQFLTEVFGSW